MQGFVESQCARDNRAEFGIARHLIRNDRAKLFDRFGPLYLNEVRFSDLDEVHDKTNHQEASQNCRHCKNSYPEPFPVTTGFDRG